VRASTPSPDRFRAYRTAEEGATDYVKLISQRFPEAARSAQQGDPMGFVAVSSNAAIYGRSGAYTRSVSSLTARAFESRIWRCRFSPR